MSTIRVPPVMPKCNLDCIDLNSAFKGLGCDTKKVIDILGHRRLQYRSQLKEVYKNMYLKDLVYELKRELHHHLEKAVLLWMCEPAERDAVIFREALKGWGSKDGILIEILCFRTSIELQSIIKAYNAKYGRSLVKDVESATGGFTQKFFLALLATNRPPENTEVDKNLAEREAKELYGAREGSVGLDENTFIRVLTSRNATQLRSTFDAYKRIYGHEIHKVLKRQPSGGFQETLKTVTKCIQRPPRYFAKVLYKSMNGLGTNDEALIRVVVTRAEVDMQEVKSDFKKKYNKTLGEMITSDTSGSYRQFLLTLIGEDV